MTGAMGLLAESEGRGAAVSRRAVVGLAFVLVLGPIALRADAQPRRSIPRVALLCAVWCEALQSLRHEEGQAFVHARSVNSGRSMARL